MTQPDSAGVPTPDGLSLPYCDHCGEWRIAARQFCAVHPGHPLAHRRIAGRGTVFSLTVSHVAMSAEVKDKVPYVTVLVAVDDGPRLLAHVEGATDLRIGDPVQLVAAGDGLRAALPGGGPRLARPETPEADPA